MQAAGPNDRSAVWESVELAFVDQGYTGADPAEAASGHGMRLEVVKHAERSFGAEAKRGFVLLPRRWVAPPTDGGERSFAWVRRFRRLAKDYERLPETVAGLHLLAFVCLMLPKAALLMAASP